MKRKLIISSLVLMLIAVPLFAAACEEEVTPPSEEEEEGPPGEEEEEEEGNWWDELGEPQYGGKLTVIADGFHDMSFDPAVMGGSAKGCWEALFYRDWTVDRSICDFKIDMVPVEYYGGGLAESWEQTDPLTWTVHLRQGVHWQDKPPLNGRELTADDVVYTYDRLLGTGSGFTEPNPFVAASFSNFERVVWVDKYTVQFKLKSPTALSIYDIYDLGPISAVIVAPELVQQGLEDWHNAAGTGPYMLTDYDMGVSTTYSRNPDYWGYDERHPQNQLPYIDTVVQLVIPDISSQLAALRSGQIDLIPGGPQWQQVQSLTETNPDIQHTTWPFAGQSLEMRCDREPFTDIRVRKALQMAIDRELIAETYYGGLVSGVPEGLVSPMSEGWAIPYDQWPADLQQEYSYNPDMARQLLAEAAADGVFEVNEYGGFNTNIIASTVGDDDIQLLEIIKSQLMDIGVDMEIIAFADMPTKNSFVQAGNMDAMTSTWTTGGLPAPAYRQIEIRLSDKVENYTYNNDSYYDDLVQQVITAPTIDEAKRLVKECDMYALEQHWAVNLFLGFVNVCWQPWIKGYSGERLIWGGQFFYYSRWWIDQE